jgi:hypothetical protein
LQISDNYYAYILQDIHERVMLEEQLKQNQLHLQELVDERTKELQDALNVKSRFIATVSHGK